MKLYWMPRKSWKICNKPKKCHVLLNLNKKMQLIKSGLVLNFLVKCLFFLKYAWGIGFLCSFGILPLTCSIILCLCLSVRMDINIIYPIITSMQTKFGRGYIGITLSVCCKCNSSLTTWGIVMQFYRKLGHHM